MIWRSRPRPHWRDDAPAGGDPPADAEKAVEKAEVAVEKAEATGDPKAIATAEARLKAAEDRLAKLETDFVSHRQAVDGKANSDHAHEMPSELKALHESLREVEDEETAPKRDRHFLYRPLFRRHA